MKKYIDQVKAQPRSYIFERNRMERLLGVYQKNTKFPIMYYDHFIPSFYKTLLCGLDFDFMMMEVLIVACLDRATYKENKIQSGLVVGVLIAYILDYLLIWLKQHYGKMNLARNTLSDERFLFN
mmetsp:Transcript_4701/g.8016  ORF Transcript_4701/g.8016 Transcript_4701/m.8016 type:complete len:124 (+) Transcript_4701:2799-3170(+)